MKEKELWDDISKLALTSKFIDKYSEKLNWKILRQRGKFTLDEMKMYEGMLDEYVECETLHSSSTQSSEYEYGSDTSMPATPLTHKNVSGKSILGYKRPLVSDEHIPRKRSRSMVIDSDDACEDCHCSFECDCVEIEV